MAKSWQSNYPINEMVLEGDLDELTSDDLGVDIRGIDYTESITVIFGGLVHTVDGENKAMDRVTRASQIDSIIKDDYIYEEGSLLEFLEEVYDFDRKDIYEYRCYSPYSRSASIERQINKDHILVDNLGDFDAYAVLDKKREIEEDIAYTTYFIDGKEKLYLYGRRKLGFLYATDGNKHYRFKVTRLYY